MRQRDAFAGGREQADIFDGLAGVAILLLIAQGDVEARLALLHLGDGVGADGGLDRVLNVGNVDAPARGGVAVDGEVQVGLADDAEDAQILDAFDRGHLRLDLFGLVLQRAQIVAVELDGQLALDAGDGLFHVVGDGLRVVPDDAGELLTAPCRWRRSALPCSDGRRDATASLRFRSTKYSVLKKPAVSVPSSGRPVWLTTCVTSGNEAITRRALLVKSMLAVGPSLGGSVPRTQMEPSSRWGRNSEPMGPPKVR